MSSFEEIDNLLKSRNIDFNKLLEYGFEKKKNQYEYRANLIENEFDLIVSFSNEKNKINIKVIDINSNEEYLLVKVPNAIGEYVGKIREECKSKLIDIIEKCSEIEVFKSYQAKQVIKYIKEKYENSPEFLWAKCDGNAVFRHKENNKWYGLLVTISKSKLGLDSEEIVNAINLKGIPENIEKIVDNERYFLAYHMNKKHWVTIILDESVEIEEIFKFIDVSFNMI